jgi:hypothetical protein
VTYSRQQRHKARLAKVRGGPGTLRVEQVDEEPERMDDEFHDRGVRERHEELRERFREPGPIGDPDDLMR